MRSPIEWFVDWMYARIQRKDEARSWHGSTPTKHPERVTEGISPLIDLYDTTPIQRVVNASVRVEEVPPVPVPRPPGETTNVLRQYYAPRKGVAPPPPGTYVRIYRVLCTMGVLPHSGGKHP